MSNNSSDSLHVQLAAVIEVLANSAVAEICKLVDDGYAVLRLEITQNQRELDGLRRKLLVAKFQTSRRNNHHLDKLSALGRNSSAVHHVTCGPSVPSGARCNPVTKSSTQGTGGEEDDGGAGFPIILKVEGDDNTLKDIQPPVKHGSETNTRASAKTTPRTLTVEPENHLHRVDQRFNTCHHSNRNVNGESHHPSSDRNKRFTTTSHNDGNLFTSASEWAEAGAGIEVWNNAGSLTTGNCSLDPSHNSGPHQEGRTGSNSDGREGSPGASEDWGGDVSGESSNVAPPLAGNLDWEPDMVVVDSVPIKVEADMSSEWSIINRDGITRSAKQRLKKHGREEELEAAHSTLTLNTKSLDRTTCLKSSLVVNTSATSYGGLSSFPSSFSATKTPRQVLHPQANQVDNRSSSSLNEIAASSARTFSRLLSFIPPMALPAQPARDAEGQPFRCELCGKTFRKLPNLRLHQRVHTGEKPYGCRHCSRRFSRQHQLKYHERVHTGEKPFRCPICGRCFVQTSNMKRHLRIHK